MPVATEVDDRGGDRTRGLRIKSPLLYQLSYPVAFAAHQLSYASVAAAPVDGGRADIAV